MLRILSIGLLLSAPGLAQPAKVEKNPFLGAPLFDLQEPFFKEFTRPGHWLPTLTVAMDGSVLVFRDRRDQGIIQVFRSEDGGRKWQKPVTVGKLVEIEGDTFDGGRYNDWHHNRSILGTVVVDETNGDILVFMTSMKPAEVIYRSGDHGKTWKQEKITIHPDRNGWLTCVMATCEPGITLKYGKHKGRLLLPTRVFVNYFNKGNGGKHFKDHYSNALYSDDHGKTWHPSAPFPETGTGEAGLVELSDGRIYYNSRTHTRPGNKRIAWSGDGGQTWGPASESAHLPDGPPDVYGCKAGLLRLPVEGKNILIYSSPKDPRAKKRNDIMLRVSYNGSRSWPTRRLVTGGPGSYTWLAAGRKGTPSEGLLYMLSWENTLLRFNLAWIEAGKEEGTNE